ncbi:hypothetical protein ACQKFM_04795 [Paenibacillus xylanexedens]|uniref:hypothetical protein n=1 Tax=Paenibacillus xylanexedens TaxID=528191 RepID=UPI003D04083A
MYKKHCKNLRELENAIKLIQRDLRRYISTEQNSNEYSYTKILSYLVTCWAEVRILKVAFEQNAYNQKEISEILNASTLEDKWITALNISFCKAYRIRYTNDCDVIESKLPFTDSSRYSALLSLIKNDLVESIEVRNRIAHGQWLFAFTNDLKNFPQELTTKLRVENIVKLQLKMNLFKNLAKLIHDLAVSPKTFIRDFDDNYKNIEQQKKNLHKRDYNKYKQHMILKYQRGLAKRRHEE